MDYAKVPKIYRGVDRAHKPHFLLSQPTSVIVQILKDLRNKVLLPYRDYVVKPRTNSQLIHLCTCLNRWLRTHVISEYDDGDHVSSGRCAACGQIQKTDEHKILCSVYQVQKNMMFLEKQLRRALRLLQGERGATLKKWTWRVTENLKVLSQKICKQIKMELRPHPGKTQLVLEQRQVNSVSRVQQRRESVFEKIKLLVHWASLPEISLPASSHPRFLEKPSFSIVGPISSPSRGTDCLGRPFLILPVTWTCQNNQRRIVVALYQRYSNQPSLWKVLSIPNLPDVHSLLNRNRSHRGMLDLTRLSRLWQTGSLSANSMLIEL